MVYILLRAATQTRTDIMTILMDAGVVDTGRALLYSVGEGLKVSVKTLLEQHKGEETTHGDYAYVDTRDPSGAAPLVFSIDVDAGQVCFPRVARLLVDAGADTMSAVRVTGIHGEVLSYAPPLVLTNYILADRRNVAFPRRNS